VLVDSPVTRCDMIYLLFKMGISVFFGFVCGKLLFVSLWQECDHGKLVYCLISVQGCDFNVKIVSNITFVGMKYPINYDWVMQNTPPSDLAKCELAPYSSSIYSWLSNEPICIKI
jgi:hypothetical protein